jgi:tetratricopeptide (TPR) repeat protein
MLRQGSFRGQEFTFRDFGFLDEPHFSNDIRNAFNRVLLFVNESRYQDALAVISRLTRICSWSPLNVLHADILFRLNRYTEARDILTNLLQNDAQDPKILKRLGQLSMCLGEFGQARRYFSRLADLLPCEKTAWINGNFIAAAFDNQHDEDVFSQRLSRKGDAENFPSISIITSIPPKNNEMHIHTTMSWLSTGANVLSLNLPDEIVQLRPVFPHVTFVPAERDASSLVGKPIMYLDDIFHVLGQTGSDLCGIVNADVMLRADKEFVKFLAAEVGDGLLFGSRVDVGSYEHKSGRFYDAGFDYFFFRPSLIEKIPASSFCLGAPWWDYFFPFISVITGLEVKMNLSPLAFHIFHEPNWSALSYYNFGYHLYQFVSPQFTSQVADRLDFKIGKDTIRKMIDSLAGFVPAYLYQLSKPSYYRTPFIDSVFAPPDIKEHIIAYPTTLVSFKDWDKH